LAKNGLVGRVKTIPTGMQAGSDVAIISILGYDPKEYYTGRGPLEAANLGIELEEEDIVFRCNLVTVYEDKLVDYSAGHITTPEASTLMNFLNQKLGSEKMIFYPGVSYRNLLLIKNAESNLEKILCKPPHDIIGQSITPNLPKGEGSEFIIKLMQESKKLLENHEVNQVRIDLKENPANMIWLWGQGKKPKLPSFKDKYGLTGSVISAVDLIKGLGRILGLEVINVKGATGYYDTNYEGKASSGIESLKKKDFLFLHLEAPDEAGHNGDLREKVTAIERFDQFIVGRILEHFKDKEDFRILVLPDHATPLSLRTHTADIVPFVIYGKGIKPANFSCFSEKEAEKSTLYFEKGFELLDYFIKGI
ncbi:MAG: cofactor-independent phosphoglycerate mutase, partial [Candidatus Omnitrophica bacterium]|nr:cofactor-independent phosphoglycerate mutase [Candidatus Omnitrophota bacterium]